MNIYTIIYHYFYTITLKQMTSYKKMWDTEIGKMY